MTVKLEGLENLKDVLLYLGAVAGVKHLASACRAAMAPVLAEAQRLAPSHTGQLRDSLRIKARKPTSGAVVAEAGLTFGTKVDSEIPATLDEDSSAVGDLTVTSTVKSHARWIWHFSEFGTVKMKAHPFLRPAIASTKEQALQIFKEVLARKVQRAIRKQLERE